MISKDEIINKLEVETPKAFWMFIYIIGDPMRENFVAICPLTIVVDSDAVAPSVKL